MLKEQLYFSLRDSTLIISLPSKVDFAISNNLLEVLNYRQDKGITFIVIDFSKTNFVSLPGALFLLAFMILYKRRNNNHILVQLEGTSSTVSHFLMTIGFYSKVSNIIGLPNRQKIAEKEQRMLMNIRGSESSIIFPITSIGYNTDKSSFEEYTKTFINRFRAFYAQLIRYPIYNFSNDPDDFQEMFEAAHEVIKNIFDHSESEGFGAIQASSYLKGTTIAFYDTGIGIAKSVLNSGFGDFTSDIGAIEWAFKDGNSRNKNGKNQGHGFTVLKHFCKQRNGILTVRSTKYLCIYSRERWEIKEVNYFPGTQVVLYNPIKKI